MTEPTDRPMIDAPLLRGLTQRRMSRREALRAAGVGVGALSLASILAACGNAGRNQAASGGPSIDWNAAPAKTVNFANWPYYIDKKRVNGTVVYPSLQKFTEATGIAVNYDGNAIQANAEFFGKIQPDLATGKYCGYDIVVITNGETLTRMIQLNYLVPLPADKHPNFDANASAAVKDPTYDPGNKHTMAWQSGLTGIGWDPKQVAELRPSNPKITSIHDLWDPAFKGKVGMFADNADLPNFAMLALDIKPETSTPDDWQKTADLLNQQKNDGIVRSYYEQNYINALNNGDVAVTMAWSGDIYQSNTTGESSGLQFTVPTEGAIIWTDNMCIPIGVEHPVDAIQLMDFVYQPDIQGIIEDYNDYICPVPASKDYILNTLKDPDVANSALVFPTQEELANTHKYRVLTTAEQSQWNGIFQPIYQS